MGKVKKFQQAALKAQQLKDKQNPRALSKSSMFETRDREELAQQIPLKVGEHQFRVFRDIFDDPHVREFPAYESIPMQYRKNSNHKAVERASEIFFHGFRPRDIICKYPEGVDRKVFDRSVVNTLWALSRSHEPSHDLKMATVAWCLDEWTVL